ncbi:hypothetical protein EDB85DRAFT_1929329 [Lactarius pseudohatsudake]|nr:hypothetical protein EDB85DRAFT_1994319 [Lactarius pseudohatsudake]KAH9039659.1 hypothetical protein EDB85DRAFT_1929329 [Lactarius pseudohatsudake]
MVIKYCIVAGLVVAVYHTVIAPVRLSHPYRRGVVLRDLESSVELPSSSSSTFGATKRPKITLRTCAAVSLVAF